MLVKAKLPTQVYDSLVCDHCGASVSLQVEKEQLQQFTNDHRECNLPENAGVKKLLKK